VRHYIGHYYARTLIQPFKKQAAHGSKCNHQSYQTHLPKLRWAFCIDCFLCLFFCSASYGDNQSKDEFASKQFRSKLSHKHHMNEGDTLSESKLRKDKTVGYSHKFKQFLGIDLYLDTYLYTDQEDNSFKWIVGVVTDLLKIKNQTDQSSK
jgi:Pyruvate/2-oxoacid:ferredoxin oxidoreductase delta subunit